MQVHFFKTENVSIVYLLLQFFNRTKELSIWKSNGNLKKKKNLRRDKLGLDDN